MKSGKMFVFSAPSGAGKTTLAQKLLDRDGQLVRSVSMTTRLPRKGERNGKDYFFTTKEDFLHRQEQGEFLEWAEVFGSYYVTPRRFVERKILQGKDVIACLDVQGAIQIKKKCPQATLIFILPPKMEELTTRLKKRKTDSLRQIRLRLKTAKWEIEQRRKYDYTVVNVRLSRAVKVLQAIVTAERHRVEK